MNDWFTKRVFMNLTGCILAVSNPALKEDKSGVLLVAITLCIRRKTSILKRHEER